jgi:hypothetical protein
MHLLKSVRAPRRCWVVSDQSRRRSGIAPAEWADMPKRQAEDGVVMVAR